MNSEFRMWKEENYGLRSMIAIEVSLRFQVSAPPLARKVHPPSDEKKLRITLLSMKNWLIKHPGQAIAKLNSRNLRKPKRFTEI